MRRAETVMALVREAVALSGDAALVREAARTLGELGDAVAPVRAKLTAHADDLGAELASTLARIEALLPAA
jgi:phage host-nuclease inhibitor protein Gam